MISTVENIQLQTYYLLLFDMNIAYTMYFVKLKCMSINQFMAIIHILSDYYLLISWLCTTDLVLLPVDISQVWEVQSRNHKDMKQQDVGDLRRKLSVWPLERDSRLLKYLPSILLGSASWAGLFASISGIHSFL